MPSSMTGFGGADATFKGINVSVAIKSVNSRYLEISVKSPQHYSPFENDIRLLVKSKVARGKVEVAIRETDDVLQMVQDVVCNKPLLDKYMENLREIGKDYSLSDDLSVADVSRLPGVFCLNENSGPVLEWEDIKQVFKDSLEDFLVSRKVEGKRLCKDILNNISLLEDWILVIKDQVPNMLKEYKDRLSEKLESVLESRDIDDTRLLMEVALFTDRTDVSEELTRLDSHIASLKELLMSSSDVGRKCDFIVQEVNREINTIGSKTKSIRISEVVIESKTIVEKIREQIQNLE